MSSSSSQPSTSLGCEVCPEVLLALREISAVTELLDRAQPDLNLRGGAEGCLRRFKGVDTLMGLALRRAPAKPCRREHQQSASRLYYFFLSPAERERTI